MARTSTSSQNWMPARAQSGHDGDERSGGELGNREGADWSLRRRAVGRRPSSLQDMQFSGGSRLPNARMVSNVSKGCRAARRELSSQKSAEQP